MMNHADLIISAVMLRNTIFSKVTAAVGMVGNVLELGLPGVSVPFAVEFAIVGIGGVLLVIWYILIARRIFLLAQSISKEEAKQPTEVSASELVSVNECQSHEG